MQYIRTFLKTLYLEPLDDTLNSYIPLVLTYQYKIYLIIFHRIDCPLKLQCEQKDSPSKSQHEHEWILPRNPTMNNSGFSHGIPP